MSTAKPAVHGGSLVEAATKDSTVVFGFWVYIMTDCVLFASLFAVYAVLRGNSLGGPTGTALYSLPYILAETLILLTSSFTCGLSMLAVRAGHVQRALVGLGVTFALGCSFLALELTDFAHLASSGNSWQRSGFLSSFFTLVGTHGLHITVGLLWMLVLIAKVAGAGLTRSNVRKLTLLSIFWHFLDVIWIFIFTIVYLLGAVQS